MNSEVPSFTVSEVIGPFLRIGGLFVVIGGAWIFMFEYTPGVALQINDLGPLVMVSGLFSYIVGSLIVGLDHRDVRSREYWLGPEAERLSKGTPAPPATALRVSSSPSFGYENLTGGFFCEACQLSPLASRDTWWTIARAERSVLGRKVRRAIAIRSAKRNPKRVSFYWSLSLLE